MAEELLVIAALLAPFFGLVGGVIGYAVDPINRTWVFRKMLQRNYGLAILSGKGGRMNILTVDFSGESFKWGVGGNEGTYFLDADRTYLYRNMPTNYFIEGTAEAVTLEEALANERLSDPKMVQAFVLRSYALAEQETLLEDKLFKQLLWAAAGLAGVAAIIGFVTMNNCNAAIDLVHQTVRAVSSAIPVAVVLW